MSDNDLVHETAARCALVRPESYDEWRSIIEVWVAAGYDPIHLLEWVEHEPVTPAFIRASLELLKSSEELVASFEAMECEAMQRARPDLLGFWFGQVTFFIVATLVFALVSLLLLRAILWLLP